MLMSAKKPIRITKTNKKYKPEKQKREKSSLPLDR